MLECYTKNCTSRGFPRLVHVNGFDAEPVLRINPEVAEAWLSPGSNRLPKTPNSTR